MKFKEWRVVMVLKNALQGILQLCGQSIVSAHYLCFSYYFVILIFGLFWFCFVLDFTFVHCVYATNLFSCLPLRHIHAHSTFPVNSPWSGPCPAPAPFDRCSSNKLAKLFTGWLHFWYYAACLASLWLAVCAAAAPHCHGPLCAEVSSGCLAMFRFASLCCASLPPLLRCTSWLQAPLLLCSQLELALWPISR